MSVFTSGVSYYDLTGPTTGTFSKVYASGGSLYLGVPVATNYFMAQSGITQTASTVTLDFTYGTAVQSIVVTGATTFTGVNYAAGHALTVRIMTNTGNWALSWSSGWAFLGSAAPTGTISGKLGVLSVQCFDTTDTGVIAAYSAQP